jgi:hypothetical protein
MRHFSKIAIILITICLSLGLSISSFILPKPKNTTAAQEEFSAERAMKYIENIAAKPHEVGSAEHEVVRDYIVNEFKSLGLVPEIQKDTSSNTIWGRYVTGNIENIYAVLKGNGESKEAILMVTHYDSTSGGPGAGDDAVGVAAILETIRALKVSEPLKNDIIFLITDGEEMGLLGAKAFIDKNPMVKDAAMVINFEARGNTGPVIMFETGVNNSWFMKELKKAVKDPVAYSFSYEIYKYMPNDTDFTLFKKAGKEGFNFATLLGFETYHNLKDSAENLNRGTLQQEGDNALNLLKHFGNLYISDAEKDSSIYFTVGKSMFVQYSSRASLVSVLLTTILFIATFIYALKKKLLVRKSIIQGFLLTLVTIAVSSGIGAAGFKLFRYFVLNNRSKLLHSDSVIMVTKGIIWVVALLIIDIAVFYIFYISLSRKLAYENMIFGGLILWLILTLISSILFKAASYLFLWPTIFILLGIILQFVIKSETLIKYRYLLLMVLAVTSCIIIYAPVLFFIFEALGISAAAILGGVAAIPLSSIVLSSLIFFQGKYTLVSKNKVMLEFDGE